MTGILSSPKASLSTRPAAVKVADRCLNRPQYYA
jgi:hypothetical protein